MDRPQTPQPQSQLEASRRIVHSAIRLALREAFVSRDESALDSITAHVLGSIEARHVRNALRELAREEG